MVSTPIVVADNLIKEYRLGVMGGVRQNFSDTLDRLRGHTVLKRPLFKALDNISFRIEKGEVVGIIGHNGAGKSTLLKMLAGISKPTSGSLSIRGSVAPLIEVGAGFIPDFTGRENVYLNGSILGLSRRDIDQKFDEIVDFAEMAEFIDTPVKRYSSGMQVKLAFAVATSIEADTLIVDEVLAVGDLAFQRKCFDRMESLIQDKGRTVLLVSHNIRQVERICSRVIVLDHGKVIHDGDTKAACDLYYAKNDEKIKENALKSGQCAHLETTSDIELLGVRLNGMGGEDARIQFRDDVSVVVDFRTKTTLQKPSFGIGVHTTDFVYLGTDISEACFHAHTLEPGDYSVACDLGSLPFTPGAYSLRFGMNAGQVTRTVFYAESILGFQIMPPPGGRTEAMREGFVTFDGDWKLSGVTP